MRHCGHRRCPGRFGGPSHSLVCPHLLAERPAPPRQLLVPQAEVTARSLQLQWVPGSDGASPIRYFTAQVRELPGGHWQTYSSSISHEATACAVERYEARRPLPGPAALPPPHPPQPAPRRRGVWRARDAALRACLSSSTPGTGDFCVPGPTAPGPRPLPPPQAVPPRGPGTGQASNRDSEPEAWGPKRRGVVLGAEARRQMSPRDAPSCSPRSAGTQGSLRAVAGQ